MRDDPKQIAEHLLQQHGPEGALAHAVEMTQEAQRAGDNYALSVWRDVKRILGLKKAG